MHMRTPVIVDAVRTPFGKRDGVLSRCHSTHALGHVQKALIARSGLRPEQIDQVVGGCVTQVGEQAFNTTRMAWLAAGLPHGVGASTVDCQCGSSQYANHLVSAMIATGEIDIGIACGVEMMSRVSLGANTANGPGHVKTKDFPYDLPHQFVAAERIARKHGLTRSDVDALGLASQQRAARAYAEGRCDATIVPIEVPAEDGTMPSLVTNDEGIRGTTPEGLARLRPMLPDGIHTAGNTSQISDGASAILWMEASVARALGLRPRARILASALVGTDPHYHIEGPIDATSVLLKKAHMTIGDVDLFEINEAFAAVVLAWARTFGVDSDRTNVNGGAIALGHPMGATGCRLIANAVCELERVGRTTALVAMCCGSAVATGTILERL